MSLLAVPQRRRRPRPPPARRRNAQAARPSIAIDDADLQAENARLRARVAALQRRLAFVDLAWEWQPQPDGYVSLQVNTPSVAQCYEGKDQVTWDDIVPGDTVWRKAASNDCIKQTTVDRLRQEGQTWPMTREPLPRPG